MFVAVTDYSTLFCFDSTRHNYYGILRRRKVNGRGIYTDYVIVSGPGGSSGKALGYGLDGPGSIPGVGGVEIFLRSFVSRLVLRSTQPAIK